MNLSSMFLVAKNTLHKEMRSRVLVFLVVLSIAIILIVNLVMDFFFEGAIAPSQFGQLAENKLKIFYSIINIWSGALAALLGANCIQSDYESGVLGQILSFPIKRIEYLIARITATWGLVLLYYILSLAVGTIYFSLSSGGLGIDIRIIWALIIGSLGILAVISLSVLYSLFMPKLMAFVSVIISSIFISISNSAIKGMSFSEIMDSFGVLRAVGLFFHYLFPRIGSVNTLSSSVLTGREVQMNIPLEGGHFVLSMAILFFVMLVIFRKKEI